VTRPYHDVVASLEARVVEGERAGIYGDSGVLARFRLPEMAPRAVERPERPAPLRLRPELGFSSKALIGTPITAAKRTAERLLHHVMQNGLDQVAVHLEHQAQGIAHVEGNSEHRDAEIMRATRALLLHEARRRRELEMQVAALSEALGVRASETASPARVQQVLAAAVPHDAVTDQALALDALLTRWGHHSSIYAEHVHPDLEARVGRIRLRPVDPDVVLLRYSIWSQAVEDVLAVPPPRLGLIYHNVTPPQFLEGVNAEVAALCAEGRRRIGELAGISDVVVADSAYDAEDLEREGFDTITVIPMLLELELGPALEPTTPDGPPTVLSVGRFAPNKRIELLIASFALYQRAYAPDARLVLVGSSTGFERYRAALGRFADEIGARGVHVLGRISSEERDRWYREATVYGCTSSHEGFCAPLAEAMAAGLPVVATDSSAVPETLGRGGLVLPGADPRLIAEGIREVGESGELREAIRAGAAQRLADFAPARVAQSLHDVVTTLLAGDHGHQAR
jgi:glycosyltransferase involved in cell wall biosynthesis